MAVVFSVVSLLLSAVLAALIGRAGWIKTLTPIVKMAGSGLVWASEIPPWSVRIIGLLEIVAALVIITVPVLAIVVGSATVLTALGVVAALSVAALMGAAHLFHRARGEQKATRTTNLAFGTLAILTAASQFVSG